MLIFVEIGLAVVAVAIIAVVVVLPDLEVVVALGDFVGFRAVANVGAIVA